MRTMLKSQQIYVDRVASDSTTPYGFSKALVAKSLWHCLFYDNLWSTVIKIKYIQTVERKQKEYICIDDSLLLFCWHLLESTLKKKVERVYLLTPLFLIEYNNNFIACRQCKCTLQSKVTQHKDCCFLCCTIVFV